MRTQSSSTFPEITAYPWQWRRDYLMLVAAVAVSDEELHPDELKLLEHWIEQFKLPPKSREAVIAVVRRKPLNRRAIERRLSRTDLVYSLILDLMGMAMADGILMDKEIIFLRGIADNLKVDPIDFNILIEFIHSAHQASKLDSPEPLYEHNIESALQLLIDKKVNLFPHTLLCVSSPEFDRKLKERWVRHLAKNLTRKKKR